MKFKVIIVHRALNDNENATCQTFGVDVKVVVREKSITLNTCFRKEG